VALATWVVLVTTVHVALNRWPAAPGAAGATAAR
jgi:hypothetical protein